MASAKTQELLARVTLNRIAWFSAGPWLVFNVALTVALVTSLGFRTTFVDADLQVLDRNGWVALGMSGFPWLQGLVLAGVFFFARLLVRPRACAVADGVPT